MAALLAAGCGNDRTAPPDVATPAPPGIVRAVKLPEGGLRLRVPSNWNLDQNAGGGRIAVLSSSRAAVAIWRYPRQEPLPSDTAGLGRARDALIEYVRERDRSFDASNSRVMKVAKRPAIQLLGTESIGGVRMRVRSTHIFDRGAELVVDAYAPPDQFPTVDQVVFDPLLRSLRLTRPRS